MMEILSRNFLHPDIQFQDSDAGLRQFQEFEDTITFWKTVLYEGYNLRRGDLVSIWDASIRFDYICLFMAAAELGLKMVLVPDKPTRADGQTTKLDAIVQQYGKIKVTLIDPLSAVQPAVLAAAYRYSEKIVPTEVFNTYKISDHSVYLELKEKIFAKSDDDIIITTTSGTTGEPKIATYTHQQLYRIGKRNVTAYDYANAVTCHSRNMHHSFVLLAHFLPSLTGTKYHYSHVLPEGASKQKMLEFAEFVNANSITKLVVSYKLLLDSLLQSMIEDNLQFTHQVDLITGGFYITEDYVKKLIKTNTNSIISTFGSNETFGPLFLRKVYQTTSVEDFEINCLGHICDDFYKLTPASGNKLTVECPALFNGSVLLDEGFEFKPNGEVLHLGRDNFYRIDHKDFSLKELDNITLKHVDGNYTITVDMPYQRLYLVIWSGNVDFDSLNNEVRETIGLTFDSWAVLDPAGYNNEFKLDQDKIRNYFREQRN